MKNNKELITYKKNITTFADKVSSLSIRTEKDLKVAVSILSKLNQYGDSVKERKEALTKPINLALKNIRLMFKPLENTYETAVDNLREKMSVYQTKAIEEQKKQEEEIADKLSTGDISIEKAVATMEDMNVSGKIKTKDGDVKFKTSTKIEVMDIILLTENENGSQYIEPNMVAIRKAFSEGIKLKGVNYTEIQVPFNYR